MIIRPRGYRHVGRMQGSPLHTGTRPAFAGARRPPVKGGAAMDASFLQMAAEIKQRFNKVDNTIDQHLYHIGELRKEYEAIGRTNIFASKSLERGGRLTERQVAIREEVKAHQALVEELRKEAQTLTEAEAKLKQHQEQVEKNATAHNSLRSRIRELKEEMGTLIDRGINEQSAAYRALADELGRLQDIQGDVAQQGRILSNDEAGFQGLIAGLNPVFGVKLGGFWASNRFLTQSSAGFGLQIDFWRNPRRVWGFKSIFDAIPGGFGASNQFLTQSPAGFGLQIGF